ncbi:MAG: YbaB/EbfC family nucleoid-associated protein [Gammaproteobacteria bacterium]
MKGGIGQLMKQAQKMQENLQKAQEELSNIEVTGESGGGMVKVVMTCRHEVRRVEIEPTLLGDDKEMLEDLIAAATNDAIRRADRTAQERMGELTAGLGLPAGMNLPIG